MTGSGCEVNTVDLGVIRHGSFSTWTYLVTPAFILECSALRYSALGYGVKKMGSLGLVELR